LFKNTKLIRNSFKFARSDDRKGHIWDKEINTKTAEKYHIEPIMSIELYIIETSV